MFGALNISTLQISKISGCLLCEWRQMLTQKQGTFVWREGVQWSGGVIWLAGTVIDITSGPGHWQLYQTFDDIVCLLFSIPLTSKSPPARPASATKRPQVCVIATILTVSQPSRANQNTPGQYFINNLDWKTIKQFGNGYFITQKNAKIFELISAVFDFNKMWNGLTENFWKQKVLSF